MANVVGWHNNSQGDSHLLHITEFVTDYDSAVISYQGKCYSYCYYKSARYNDQFHLLEVKASQSANHSSDC